ncbi:MAG TPA: universal stress protein [Actinocrinis sp.]|nr:universal stress protein [Actinocrinis sp.]
MYAKILVAVDSTPESTDVLAHARELALATGSPVHVLHVQSYEVLGGIGVGGQIVEDETEADAAGFVQASVDALTSAGVTADGSTVELSRDSIADEIRAEVKQTGADLLIIGTRRHGSLATVFLGSVSDGIVHHAPCPLLLVP